MFKKFIKIINSHHWGQKTFFDMLNNLKRLKYLDPFSFIIVTIKKLRPPLKLISRVIAGKKIYTTEFIPPQNSIHFAFKWLIDAAKTRDHKINFGQNLALELADAFNKKGLAYKTKLEYNTTLKDNYRRRKTKLKKFKRRRKHKKGLKKLWLKNSRLKKNGFKKRRKSKKHHKTKFAAIKRKLSPLFRKRTILNYLTKKHQKYQKYSKLIAKKNNTNLIYTKFNIKQKVNKRKKIKKVLKNALIKHIEIKNITIKFKHKRFMINKLKQTQQKLNKIQLNAEKCYLSKLNQKMMLNDKKLQKNKKKAFKFMQKLARNLRLKLNTIINTQKSKKKLNAKPKKIVKNAVKKPKIFFFHKLLFYAQSKLFKQKVKRILKKGLIDKNQKLIAIERILRKYNLRKKLKIILVGKMRYKPKKKWSLTKKQKLKRLRFIFKPKILNTEMRNKKLAKTFLNFLSYRRGVKKFKKRLSLNKIKSEHQLYRKYFDSKVINHNNKFNQLKKKMKNRIKFDAKVINTSVVKFNSVMKLWFENNNSILKRKQKHILTTKLKQFLQYKNIRTRIKYLCLAKNLRKRKRKQMRKRNKRNKRKKHKFWKKFVGKRRTYKRKLRKKAVKRLRKRLKKWRKNKQISWPIYYAIRKRNLINRKRLNKNTEFLFNRLRSLIRRRYPPGLRSMVFTLSNAMFKMYYLPKKLKITRLKERCGKNNATRKYYAENNFVRNIFLKYHSKKKLNFSEIKLRLRKATIKYHKRDKRIQRRITKMTSKKKKWTQTKKWQTKQLKHANKRLQIKFHDLSEKLNTYVESNQLEEKQQNIVNNDTINLDKILWKTISVKAVKSFWKIISEPLYKNNFLGKPKKNYLNMGLNFNYKQLQRKKIRRKRKNYKKINLFLTKIKRKKITKKRKKQQTYDYRFTNKYIKYYFIHSLKQKNKRE